MRIEGGKRIHKIHEIDYKPPLISIITVVLNGEKHIEQTIQSVLSQSYIDIEYIIIDGGSSDHTINIIKKYDDKIEYWMSEKDKGIYDAMNKGIKLSSGKIIYTLHSDDYIYDNYVIEKVINYFATNSDLKLIYGAVKWMFFNPDYSIISTSKLSKDALKYGIIPFQPATFVKRDVFNLIGYFDVTYKISSDFEFYCNFIKHNLVYSKIDNIICCFRAGGKSANQQTAWFETGNIIKKYYGFFYYVLFFTKSKTELIIKNFLLKIGIFKWYKSYLKYKFSKKNKD